MPGDFSKPPGRDILSDVDPMKHAGEGFFATEEYPSPQMIDDPYVRGDIAAAGQDYYPPPISDDDLRRMGIL